MAQGQFKTYNENNPSAVICHILMRNRLLILIYFLDNSTGDKNDNTELLLVPRSTRERIVKPLRITVELCLREEVMQQSLRKLNNIHN